MKADPHDRSSKTRALINVGTEIAGGAAGGALGLLFSGPLGVAIGGAGGVAITKAFVAVGNEIADRFLAPRERVRVGAALAIAADTTRARIDAGSTPRLDAFVDDGTEHPPVEQITEGLLLAAQRAYDEKRVPYIGTIVWQSELQAGFGRCIASWLTRLANEVSYTQLCMLRLAVENGRGNPLLGGKIADKRVNGPTHSAYLSEILHLHGLGLINFGSNLVWSLIDIDPPAMRAQVYGVHLYDLMELGRIEDADLAPIRRVLS